jgi:mRNA interferase YafQ
MYKIVATNNFKNDVKRCKKRGYDIEKLEQVIDLLSQTGTLPPKYKPHKLTGNFAEHMECHIQPDWLLIWKQNDIELILLFTNTGTHSDLF